MLNIRYELFLVIFVALTNAKSAKLKKRTVSTVSSIVDIGTRDIIFYFFVSLLKLDYCLTVTYYLKKSESSLIAKSFFLLLLNKKSCT